MSERPRKPSPAARKFIAAFTILAGLAAASPALIFADQGNWLGTGLGGVALLVNVAIAVATVRRELPLQYVILLVIADNLWFVVSYMYATPLASETVQHPAWWSQIGILARAGPAIALLVSLVLALRYDVGLEDDDD